jgi:hypothetical protein
VRGSFMKTIALLAICGATVVGTTVVGSASVAEKGTKKQFCKAALKVGNNIRPSAGTSGYSKKAAAKLEKSFHALEAKAPTTSLKNSVATMSDFFGDIADGDTGAIKDNAADYGKAAVKFTTYLTTKCVSVSIPDITLPDITLP